MRDGVEREHRYNKRGSGECRVGLHLGNGTGVAMVRLGMNIYFQIIFNMLFNFYLML